MFEVKTVQLAALLAFLAAQRTEAQEVLYSHFEGPISPDGLGPLPWSLDCTSDFNHDGVRDCVVGLTEHLLDHSGAGFFVLSGADGSELLRGPGVAETDFGESVAVIGDITGDGTPEFLIGAFGDGTSGQDAGIVRCFDGASGERKFQIAGEVARPFFGIQVAFLGDLDSNGVDEFAVARLASVEVYSADGSGPSLVVHDSSLNGLGERMDCVGDQDGDSVPDILMYASSWAGIPGGHSGGTVVISGADSSTLLVNYEQHDSRFGRSLSVIGDMDGDGASEYIVGANQDSSVKHLSGGVFVYAGGTGQLLRAHHGQHVQQLLGFEVRGLDDIDGDGVPDYGYLDLREWEPGKRGRAHIRSGSTGALLYRCSVPWSDSGLLRIRGVGDIDGDGYGDFAIVAKVSTPQSGTHIGFVSGFAPIGSSYCEPAQPNSTGQPAKLVVRGSARINFDWLQVDAYEVPAGEFGLFLMSQSQGSTVPPGSQGTLCLGGAVIRMGGVHQASQEGRLSQRLEPSTMPVLPGETWHFQAWYRDSAGGTSNLTQAVSLQFE